MRVSSRPGDPGHANNAPGVRVYLNGRLMRGVVTADDAAGQVTVMRRDQARDTIPFDGVPAMKEDVLTGAVRIEFPE